jgi:quercetin dioxygenase-like cupin family protein
MAPPTRLSRFHTRRAITRSAEGYAWDGVQAQVYKSGQEAGREWRGIVRQVLVGDRSEATHFQLRYFEVSPGGYSSLEKHHHAHVVIAVRGRGRAILGATGHEMQPFDTVYVAPWTPHQFLALGDEPFGFFCIVDTARDRPQSVSPAEQDCAVKAGAVSDS